MYCELGAGTRLRVFILRKEILREIRCTKIEGKYCEIVEMSGHTEIGLTAK